MQSLLQPYPTLSRTPSIPEAPRAVSCISPLNSAQLPQAQAHSCPAFPVSVFRAVRGKNSCSEGIPGSAFQATCGP